MNLRQKLSGIAIILLIFFIYTALNSYGSETTALCTQSVKFSGGTRNISYVTVDLNDSTIRIEPVVANNQIGKTDSLKNIANQIKSDGVEVLAAINGTFFSAYDNNPLPYGTIQRDGEVIHIGNTGSTIGFTDKNEVKIENLFIGISGTINDKDTWYAWNINHPFDTMDAVTIFTPEYGKETYNHSYTSIIVKSDKVSSIVSGKANIPSDGYVIVTGLPTMVGKFKVGDSVKYNMGFSEINYKNQNVYAGKDLTDVWKNVNSSLGAGPTLLKNGVVTADGLAEGFFENKILTNRGQRSFIGVTKDNKLLMGVVPNVTVKELAEICKGLGLYQAMNLDGGASSGLIYKDQLVHTPGRLLSNALVITKRTPPPKVVKVRIDGEFIETQPNPVIINGRTMLPFRTIFNALKAEVDWNEAEWTAIGKKDSTTIQLPVGKEYAMVNNDRIRLDVPSLIIEGRTFIPVRFVAESLGGKVDWDGENSIVDIWTR